MASILTNTGAMTALQTLRGINKNLGTIQDQISTGKKVATAKDNAASFAIAAVMKADVAGFKALSESLATGSATVGVARAGAETVVGLLEELKGRIVAANSDSADRGKIQSDVAALRNQIIETVNASQFNGLNLLQADTSDYISEVLSSLNRTSTGVTATNINVARQSLEAAAATTVIAANAGSVAGNNDIAVQTTDFRAGDVFAVQFNDVGLGEKFVLSVTIDSVMLSSNATFLASSIAIAMNSQLQDIGYTGTAFTITNNAANFRVARAANAGLEIFSFISESGTAGAPAVTDAEFAKGAQNFNLTTLNAIDVGTKLGATSALGAIEGLIQRAVTAASNFGSSQKRIELQSEFVKNITDSLTTGIGALVDADLEAASARLQALQVQQQLGTQSLSIANQQPQNILALFR